MRLFLLFLLTIGPLSAQECSWQRGGKPSVGWTAYKTAAKVGVEGSFAAVNFEGASAAKSLEGLLVGSRVYLQTNSVDSGNSARDSRLIQFFFNLMSGQMLKARIVALKARDSRSGGLELDVTMNGMTQTVPMRYTIAGQQLKADGTIDLADFKALPALRSINKACFNEHEGKTWQDVAIGFSMNVKRICR